MATSGDTEQYVRIDGRRYSHIIDPRTGIALTNRVIVTVVAPDATTADALASAASVLGPEGATGLAVRFPGSRIWIGIQSETNRRGAIELDSALPFPTPAR